MICLETGGSRRTFNRIHAIHPATAVGVAAIRPVIHVHRVSGKTAVQKVCVQTDDYVGVLEVVTRLYWLTESSLRARIDGIPIDWIPLVPLHLREFLLQRSNLCGERRRSYRAGQQPETSSAHYLL